jgi:hypothetical protein
MFGARYNQEMFETTSYFMAARETAMSRLQAEMQLCGADGVVDVDVGYEIEHFEYEGRNTYGSGYSSTTAKRMALLVSFNIIGTAIKNPEQGTKPVISSPLLVQDLASGKGRGFELDLEDM